MAGNANALLSGTAMAVLVGAASIMSSLLIPSKILSVGLGNRIIIFLVGGLFLGLGLLFSKA